MKKRILIALYSLAALFCASAVWDICDHRGGLECRLIQAKGDVFIEGIERFKARTGHYPEFLQDIPPEELPKLPTDYNGEPYVYVLREEGRQFSLSNDASPRGYQYNHSGDRKWHCAIE